MVAFDGDGDHDVHGLVVEAVGPVLAAIGAVGQGRDGVAHGALGALDDGVAQVIDLV